LHKQKIIRITSGGRQINMLSRGVMGKRKGGAAVSGRIHGKRWSLFYIRK
jgi:hypothetical protein